MDKTKENKIFKEAYIKRYNEIIRAYSRAGELRPPKMYRINVPKKYINTKEWYMYLEGALTGEKEAFKKIIGDISASI